MTTLAKKDLVLPLYLPTCGPHSLMPAFRGQSSTTITTITTTSNWPAANLGVYIPVHIPWDYPVKRIFWVNGSVVSGNVDFGIYSLDGFGKIYSSGAIAQAGTSVTQYTTVDFLLNAGMYLFALSLSSGTGRISSLVATLTVSNQKYFGMLEQASAHPLPNPLVPATPSTNTLFPIFGVTRWTG